jgi:ABC-2 type transport system permease protein
MPEHALRPALGRTSAGSSPGGSSPAGSSPAGARHDLWAGAPDAVAPGHGAQLWDDAVAMVARSWRLSLRNVEGLITALALPVMLMLMFVYLFGGAIHTGLRYVDYVVPGVLMVCVGFGAGTTAVSVAHDLTGAVMDRFRSMGVRSQMLFTGHVIASVGRNLASTGLVIIVALAVGFRPHADLVEWLAAVGMLALFILALSWFSAALGVVTKSAEAANGMTFIIGFLAYPSSAFVPIRTMPGWLQPIARNQPETLVVNTLRGLLDHGAIGSSAWQAALWSVGTIVVSIVLAAVLYRRRAL